MRAIERPREVDYILISSTVLLADRIASFAEECGDAFENFFAVSDDGLESVAILNPDGTATEIPAGDVLVRYEYAEGPEYLTFAREDFYENFDMI